MPETSGREPEAKTDVLGAPYTSQTLTLEPDAEGEVVATLVHRPASAPSSKAVLHVHGFADYFFQTVAADFWVARGYDFYALDLRKYGRSLRPHQTPNYVDDLTTYYEELDRALAIITPATTRSCSPRTPPAASPCRCGCRTGAIGRPGCS